MITAQREFGVVGNQDVLTAAHSTRVSCLCPLSWGVGVSLMLLDNHAMYFPRRLRIVGTENSSLF